jgi:DNA topoisomerase 2-associated protein PAT1
VNHLDNPPCLSPTLAVIMSGGFFGFGDSALPERRDRPPHQQPRQQPPQQQQHFTGFASADTFGAGAFGNKGEDEDLAVYTWGQGGSLLEGGDDLNDETFGDLGDIGELFPLCRA